MNFDELAALHVGDLFGRPRRFTKPHAVKRPKPVPQLPPSRMPRLKAFAPIDCPMCKRRTDVPEIDILIEHYRVPLCEERVLRAVWRGKGRAVQTERIFDAMYADDPDGGPSPERMYRAFKALLHSLRVRLAGSGVTVENVGYRQGYRIVIGDE